MITKRAQIGVIDSHPIVRLGLRGLIEQERDLEVCFVADDGTEALAIMEIRRPDLIVTEASFHPGHGVIEFLRDLQLRFGDIPVLVLSVHDEKFFAERVLSAGARGYAMKSVDLQLLLGAMRRVLSGEIHLSPAMMRIHRDRRHNAAPSNSANRLAGLTDREFEIFELVGEGRRSREIAEILEISPKTVETHRGHIREKLGLSKGGGLVQFASQWFAVESALASGG
jgi:DNA-binding NarL/FixJ family response regulator